MPNLPSTSSIESRIFVLRNHKILMDADLAELYGVPPRRLREQVRRNPDRSPCDFMFQIHPEERAEVSAKCGTLSNLRFSNTLPFAFTEHGALMAASVLNSPVAIQVSVEVIRAFSRLRKLVASNRDLTEKMAALETKYDRQFETVFEASTS